MEDYENLEGFTIRPYRSKRLAEYSKRMSADDLTPLMDSNVKAALQLQSLPVEESPRSIYKVSKLYDALRMYSPKNSFRVQFDEDVKSGVALAYTCFARPSSKQKLSALELCPKTVELVTSNPSGSAGLTAYGSTKQASKVRALARARQTLVGEKGPEACIAFKRTQFNDKTRLVWGYPYAMTVIEGLVAYPLLQEFKGGWSPMAFAMPTSALGAKLRVASYRKKWAYSIDMSQFDSSISAKLINVAFNILRTWYDLDEIEPNSGQSVRDIFKLIEKYFITTPIVMPNRKLYLGKRHGVPSGSFFTQIVDSIVNVIVAGTISQHFSLNVDARDIFVLGDDLLMWSNRKMDLDDIASYVTRKLGIKMHGSEKSNIYRFDEAVHYLGRDWPNGVPTIDESEILKRMLFPERFRRYSKDPQTRQREVQQLIMSYATTYWSAWKIIQDTLGTDLWYLQDPEILDKQAYGSPDELVNPDHLSGLMRYRMKYNKLGESGVVSTTGQLFWL